MQDIKRSELLDKLAAGWKVRRKSWALRRFMSQGDGNISVISWQEMIENDWEGEPPGPMLRDCEVGIVHAFERLFDGAAFIRRTAWKDKDKRYTQGVFSISLQVEELLATDWEVWR